MFSDTSGNLETYTNAEWQALLKNEIKRVAASLGGYQIRYLTDTTSTYYRGTGMANTEFNGQTQLNQEASTDDYRSQFVPSGSTTTIATYYLRPTLS